MKTRAGLGMALYLATRSVALAIVALVGGVLGGERLVLGAGAVSVIVQLLDAGVAVYLWDVRVAVGAVVFALLAGGAVALHVAFGA